MIFQIPNFSIQKEELVEKVPDNPPFHSFAELLKAPLKAAMTIHGKKFHRTNASLVQREVARRSRDGGIAMQLKHKKPNI